MSYGYALLGVFVLHTKHAAPYRMIDRDADELESAPIHGHEA